MSVRALEVTDTALAPIVAESPDLVDRFAAAIGKDPADVRRQNLVAADAFPYTNALGTTYDSGNYEAALDQVLRAVDYPALRAEQASGLS